MPLRRTRLVYSLQWLQNAHPPDIELMLLQDEPCQWVNTANLMLLGELRRRAPHRSIGPEWGDVVPILDAFEAARDSGTGRAQAEPSMLKRPSTWPIMPHHLAEVCAELVRKGTDFQTIWTTLLKGHSLVSGNPESRLEGNRPVLAVRLITGEFLVFDGERRKFSVK